MKGVFKCVHVYIYILYIFVLFYVVPTDVQETNGKCDNTRNALVNGTLVQTLVPLHATWIDCAQEVVLVAATETLERRMAATSSCLDNRNLSEGAS